jgi:hypothetical protein
VVLLDATSNIPFSTDPTAFILIGLFVPLGGYLINAGITRLKKEWDNETVKTAVQVGLVAIATGIWDSHLKHAKFWPTFFSALVSAMYAHNWLWKPSDVNVIAGAAPTGDQTTKGLSAKKYGANQTADQVRQIRA